MDSNDTKDFIIIKDGQFKQVAHGLALASAAVKDGGSAYAGQYDPKKDTFIVRNGMRVVLKWTC